MHSHLTDADRARLRPSVDVEALERFLDAIPEEDRAGVRRVAVLHFSRHVTMADVRDFLAAIGNEEAAAQIDRGLAIRAEKEPEAVPADQFFTMERPESPRLRALWDAIEPEAPNRI
jgi:hypothetical protein